MPTPAAEEPLSQATIKLFKRDIEFLKKRYGLGWTGKVRSIVREHLKILRQLKAESSIMQSVYEGEIEE